jgi:DNA-binding transcriptional MerR regulator
MANDTTLTVDQLAERWGVTRKTLENYRKQGYGPVPQRERVGMTRRHILKYREADVLAHELANGAPERSA